MQKELSFGGFRDYLNSLHKVKIFLYPLLARL